MCADISQILEKSNKINTLVFGDVMLDCYISGNVDRISPESNAPVLHQQKESFALGGAGNLLRNLCDLNTHTTFISVIGKDMAGDQIKTLINQCDGSDEHLISDTSRPTIQKIRLMKGEEHLLRLDIEQTHAISEEKENLTIETFEKCKNACDVIVLSDYKKGFLTDNLIQYIIQNSDKPVLIDPKGNDYAKYKGAFAITPNVNEINDILGTTPKSNQEVEQAGRALIDQFGFTYVVITRSEKGASLISKNDAYHYPTTARTVGEVAGAGDTFLSALAFAFAHESTPETALKFALLAAGVSVEKTGTTTASLNEIKEHEALIKNKNVA